MKIEADTAKDLVCNERNRERETGKERERLWIARKKEREKRRAGARGKGGEKSK